MHNRGLCVVHVTIDNSSDSNIYDVTNSLSEQHLCKVEA